MFFVFSLQFFSGIPNCTFLLLSHRPAELCVMRILILPQSVDAAAFARLSKGIVLKPELIASMIAAAAAVLDSAPAASASASASASAASASAFAYLQALAATDRLALNVRFLDAADTASLRATLARLDEGGYTTALVRAAFGV
jgi:hypothetical protein